MIKLPDYRFAGYTESWEEKKLGEVGDFSIKTNSFSREKLCLNSGSVKNIHYGDILVKYNSTLNFENNSIPYIIDNDTKLSSDMFLKNGDIIFSDAAEDYSVGKCVELFNVSGDIVSGLHTIVCRPQIDFARYFLGYYLNSNSYRQQVLPMVQGAKVSSISKGNLSKTNISFPSLPEQTAIGSFFQDNDQLINLQQRKLEVLKEQKKTYLKLLFPAKGQKKPALRFAGFEDEWKEVKLGEVFKISSGFTGDSSLHYGSYELTRIETISDGLINVKKLGYSNEAPDVSYKLRVGDILFSNINSIEHIGKIALYDKDYGLYHGINLLRLQPIDINGIFGFYELGTIDKRNWTRSRANKAVNQASINQTILSSLNLQIPSLPEQEAISSFFQDLDKAIAKQEEKVNQLKESKQTLLRKMFI